tara:strand:+ start:10137 stop:11321 length:1185 start_codon:yes stop_codon:yes gene_type:complete
MRPPRAQKFNFPTEIVTKKEREEALQRLCMLVNLCLEQSGDINLCMFSRAKCAALLNKPDREFRANYKLLTQRVLRKLAKLTLANYVSTLRSTSEAKDAKLQRVERAAESRIALLENEAATLRGQAKEAAELRLLLAQYVDNAEKMRGRLEVAEREAANLRVQLAEANEQCAHWSSLASNLKVQCDAATQLAAFSQRNEEILLTDHLRDQMPGANLRLTRLSPTTTQLVSYEQATERLSVSTEGANERFMFHGTRGAPPVEVALSGLTCACSRGGFYGKGLYLADRAQYVVDNFAHRCTIPGHNFGARQFLVVRTTLGRRRRMGLETRPNLAFLEDHDSVWGGPHCAGRSRAATNMAVVYADDQVLPCFVVTVEQAAHQAQIGATLSTFVSSRI